MVRRVRSERVPNNMKAKFDEITAFTDPLCREHLNEEYEQLIREATAALCRKRPSPLVRGRIDIWACGIVLAVGHANFLADSTQDPHMSSAKVCDALGVKQTTGTSKAALVREYAPHNTIRPELVSAESFGQQSGCMDDRSERPHRRCAIYTQRDSRNRLRKGVYPVHSR